MLASRIASALNPSASYGEWNDERWWNTAGTTSGAGMVVTTETALKISAFFSCLRVLGETVLSAPMTIYRKLPGGDREEAPEHPLYPMLHGDDINDEQTSAEWRETHTVHTAMRGTSYSEILSGERGPITHLAYRQPDDVRWEKLPSGQMRYKIRRANGVWEPVMPDQLFRLPGLGFNGIEGKSVIDMARDSLGISLALQQYAGSSFKNGTRSSGVLQHPLKFKDQAAVDRLRAQWSEVYAGAANAGKVVILEEGMTYNGVSMTNNDAQMLGSEQWQVADIARWFRMPLIMIQEYANSTNWGTGIEQTQIGFMVFTMLPWFIRWERRVNKELVAPLGGDYFAEFTIENLLRGDTLSRFEAYAIAAGGNAPWMHRNEVRKKENLNRGPDELDEFLQPMNMGAAGAPPPQPRGTVARPGQHAGPPELPAVDPRTRGYAAVLATQLVNKETNALQRLARKHADDGDGWKAEVTEFYEGLADQVSRDCYVEPGTAAGFMAKERDRWLGAGVKDLDATRQERVEALTALMLEDA